MGIIKSFTDSVSSSLGDQWRDIFTAAPFDEHTVVAPGILKNTNNGRGTNFHGSDGVITNGSGIFVPENTAAFIFSESGIESIITTPGNYEFHDGEDGFFSKGGGLGSFINQVGDRIGYGGIPLMEKRIAYVNLREIRNICFGTRGPLVYNDKYYHCDLEIYSYGTFSVQIIDPTVFIRNFVPANVYAYSFDYPEARKQILSEFLQSFMVALNALSETCRISQLPAQANNIAAQITADEGNAGTWPERFGFKVVKVGIENIEFSPDSRELVKQYTSNKMNIQAFEESSQHASNIAAQQKIAQGIQENGLGDGGGMLFGLNMAQALNPMAQQSAPYVTTTPNSGSQVPSATPQTMATETPQASGNTNTAPTLSLDEQIELVTKLKNLMDNGILSPEEFEAKKKEVLKL